MDVPQPLGPALEFAKRAFAERRLDVSADPTSFNGADLLASPKYEDAPPLFDLALSDEVLAAASRCLGEIPVLLKALAVPTKKPSRVHT